jgi:hypothetical protein
MPVQSREMTGPADNNKMMAGFAASQRSRLQSTFRCGRPHGCCIQRRSISLPSSGRTGDSQQHLIRNSGHQLRLPAACLARPKIPSAGNNIRQPLRHDRERPGAGIPRFNSRGGAKCGSQNELRGYAECAAIKARCHSSWRAIPIRPVGPMSN